MNGKKSMVSLGRRLNKEEQKAIKGGITIRCYKCCKLSNSFCTLCVGYDEAPPTCGAGLYPKSCSAPCLY